MGIVYQQEMNIEDSLFDDMRRDVNNSLQNLIKTMISKNSTDGSISLKINVNLIKGHALNTDPDVAGETRKTITPLFLYKVTSAMQIKDVTNGRQNCDGNELVFDEEHNKYVLKPFSDSAQMSIFDTDFSYASNDDKKVFETPDIRNIESPVMQIAHDEDEIDDLSDIFEV